MRLNPFAFPSDTTFRFLLLIAAILGVSLARVRLALRPVRRPARRGARTCSPAARDSSRTRPAADRCAAGGLPVVPGGRQRHSPRGVLFGVVALVIGGGVAYAIAVAMLRRRYRVFDRTDGPSCGAGSTRSRREIGVEPAPRLRWQPLDRRALGLAFGAQPGHRELAFTGGLVPLTVRDPAAFRAVVLHELAHLRNGDVDLSYYAIGIFRGGARPRDPPFALALLRTLVSDPAPSSASCGGSCCSCRSCT